MLNIIEINNFNAPELDVYARYTEAQLLNKDRPEDGLFIAESPKVIGRALDAGYIPISVLVEKKQMEENEETQEVLARFEDTGTPVFTAEFDVLTQLTGFKMTRGMLCVLKRCCLIPKCFQVLDCLDRPDLFPVTSAFFIVLNKCPWNLEHRSHTDSGCSSIQWIAAS